MLDHEKMHATFESPMKGNRVAKEDQLYYEEGQIAVYADRGMIDYAMQDQKLRPSSITLKGNIRVLSNNAAEAPRFGLADWITYSPTTRTFILSANPGSRVLFLDGKENLRISAQEIHLTQDGNHQTESVKGVGNVQFSFNADEEALLQKVFGLTSKQ
jgi:lipopolysaccharide export system protein LptA